MPAGNDQQQTGMTLLGKRLRPRKRAVESESPASCTPDNNRLHRAKKKTAARTATSSVTHLPPETAIPSTQTLSIPAIPLVRLVDASVLQNAVTCLSQADPRLAVLVIEHGLPDKLLAKQAGNCFQSLVRSIVYQQLAGKAAETIYSRVLACCQCADSAHLQPSHILSASQEDLRKAGLSQRKMSYLIDLAKHFDDGHLDDDMIAAMEHSELEKKLIAIKGIGQWTVDMFAMFHLGHPDILPVGDLGVRKGMQVMFQLKSLPSPDEMEKLAELWRPYRSIGSYYMWRIPTTKNAERKVDL